MFYGEYAHQHATNKKNVKIFGDRAADIVVGTTTAWKSFSENAESSISRKVSVESNREKNVFPVTPLISRDHKQPLYEK